MKATTIKIRTGAYKTDSITVNKGVKQGDLLSATLLKSALE